MLPRDGRFELMDGRVIELTPPGPFHASVVDIIAGLLREVLPESDYCVRPEKRIRLNRYFDLQPGFSVVRGGPHDYLERYPEPADMLLVAEVAESSLEYDRGEKLAAYATAGIPEYWIVNLGDGQVEGLPGT